MNRGRSVHLWVVLALLAVDLAVPAVAAVLDPGSLVAAVATAVTLLGAYRHQGLYRPRFTLDVLDDLPRIAGGAAAALGDRKSVV